MQWQAHESSEDAYAVIDVYYIVADGQLADFLECDGASAASDLVAFQVVFMETVEDLVVGEETYLHVFVDKSFVQGLVNRCECDASLVWPVVVGVAVQDFFQSLVLFLAVCQDV